MNDTKNPSSNWGDPEKIVDENFGQRSFRNIFATIGVVGAIATIAVAFFVWRYFEKQKTASIENNAKFISEAIVKRVNSTGVPPGQAILSQRLEPLLSWRVSLLPYLNQLKLLEEFDVEASWDSESNLPLSEIVVPCFQSDRARRKTPACANWVAVVGSETVIRQKRATRSEYASVKNQVAFIELLDSDIPWSQPRDVTIEEAIKLIRSSGKVGGLFCGLGNGRVIRLSANTSDKELRRLLGE